MELNADKRILHLGFPSIYGVFFGGYNFQNGNIPQEVKMPPPRRGEETWAAGDGMQLHK